ncbi:DNA polymerase eta isoform X2 [Cephus cinctus]|uniref:DNA polymerase eta n=1 Tax=Cephus cinctus TaxID=211228 RepID=A0AAJ7RIB4_CEPCN|nr:DNA polymerase eta isoform X2 [Cephus cinctus]
MKQELLESVDICEVMKRRKNVQTLCWSVYQNFVENQIHQEIGNNDEEQRKDGLDRWISSIFDELEDDQAQRLAVAGTIVEKLRAEILEITGFKCSAGISYNKILAKLACGLHKPNRQTILPSAAVPSLYSTLPVKKVRNLGGKFGDVVVESLGCNVMADLLRYTLQDLQKRFDDKTGLWLYNIARGMDKEPVVARLVCKSIGACKKFPGKQAITTMDVLQHWIGELAADVCDRLEQDFEENQRRATLLTVSYHYYQNKTTVSQSRSCPLISYKPDKITSQTIEIVTKSTQQPIAFLGISVGKFKQSKGSNNFINYFKPNNLIVSRTTDTSDSSVDKNDTQCNDALPVTQNDINDTTQHDKSSKSFFMNAFSNVNKISNKSVKNSNEHFNDHEEDTVHVVSDSHDRLGTSETIENKTDDKYDLEDSKRKSIEKLSSTTNTDNINHEEDDHGSIMGSSDNNSLSNHQSSVHSVSILESNALCSRNHDNFRENNETLVELREIFPDLNDIDPQIVSLLPEKLQREANLILKARKKNPVSNASTGKTGKVKPNKSNKSNGSKSVKNNNSISAFLKKCNPSIDSTNSLKKCLQCDQLIKVERHDEHMDFHIAQDLQQAMNESLKCNSISIKRKETIDEVDDRASKKRASDLEMSIQSKEKCNKISSFFAQL